MKKVQSPRMSLLWEKFDFSLVKSMGYDHIPKPRLKKHFWANKALDFMSKNISRDISVPDIAESLGLSAARFSEAFK